jgi:N-acetylneuraminate synthase
VHIIGKADIDQKGIELANFLEIEGRKIGEEFAPLVVAEIGINHEGSLETAIKIAQAAIDTGAEIIKHQTHIPDAEMSIEARSIIPGNTDVSIYEVINRCALTLDEEKLLSDFVRSQNIIYISTPFSFEAVDFLDDIQVPAFKIGSGECNNYPLVKRVASKGKPVILSTGMNTIETITPSVEILRKAGIPFALLHCTNLYPTPANLIRLNSILDLGRAFPDAVLGLSDHSLTNFPCLAAVGLGASILERHFTDSKSRPGPDIVCSMDPMELSQLIEGSRIIHESTRGHKYPVKEEDVTIAFAFSSVVGTRDLLAGEILTKNDITMKRPNGGDFGPRDYEGLVGKRVVEKIPKNTQIKKSQIE